MELARPSELTLPDLDVDMAPFVLHSPDDLTQHIVRIYFGLLEWNDRMNIFDMLRNFIMVQASNLPQDEEDKDSESVEEEDASEDSDTDGDVVVEETEEDADWPYTKQWIDGVDLFLQTRSLWEEHLKSPFVPFSEFFAEIVPCRTNDR